MNTQEFTGAITDGVNTVNDKISEVRKDPGRTFQRLAERALRATGSGAASAGRNYETTANNWADALPINKEQRRNRLTTYGVIAAGGAALIGTGIKFRQQIMDRYRAFTADGMPEGSVGTPTPFPDHTPASTLEAPQMTGVGAATPTSSIRPETAPGTTEQS